MKLAKTKVANVIPVQSLGCEGTYAQGFQKAGVTCIPMEEEERQPLYIQVRAAI